MPYMKLDVNCPIPGDKADPLLRDLSAALAEATGKPESVVQVAFEDEARMIMAGTEEPTAHAVVKGIGLSEKNAADLSQSICDIIEEILEIPGKRIYIVFETIKGSMWGVDGRTY